MSTAKELLRTEADNTLSFGDYTLAAKAKVEDYEFMGNLYKVKTFKEITKLEKDGGFVYESVPGTAVAEKSNKMTTGISGKLSFSVNLAGEGEIQVKISK